MAKKAAPAGRNHGRVTQRVQQILREHKQRSVSKPSSQVRARSKMSGASQSLNMFDESLAGLRPGPAAQNAPQPAATSASAVDPSAQAKAKAGKSGQTNWLRIVIIIVVVVAVVVGIILAVRAANKKAKERREAEADEDADDSYTGAHGGRPPPHLNPIGGGATARDLPLGGGGGMPNYPPVHDQTNPISSPPTVPGWGGGSAIDLIHRQHTPYQATMPPGVSIGQYPQPQQQQYQMPPQVSQPMYGGGGMSPGYQPAPQYPAAPNTGPGVGSAGPLPTMPGNLPMSAVSGPTQQAYPSNPLALAEMTGLSTPQGQPGQDPNFSPL